MWQRWRFGWVMLAYLALVMGRPGVVWAAVAPQVEVFTMGPGDDLFSRFGHAAICIADEESPLGRCYNYGTADFSTPGPLTWGVLRGNGQFWVSVSSLPHMLLLYRLGGSHCLSAAAAPVPDAGAVHCRRTSQGRSARADALQLSALRRQLHYAHPRFVGFSDILRAAAGQSCFPISRRCGPGSLTDLLRHRCFSALSQLVLGRRVDAPITGWDSMFLPDVLRAELHSHLHAVPEVVVTRVAPLPPSSSLPPIFWWSCTGLLLGLLACLGGRRSRIAVLILTVLGLLPWALAVVARLPELRVNEALLVMWPTIAAAVAASDANLRADSARWTAAGRGGKARRTAGAAAGWAAAVCGAAS